MKFFFVEINPSKEVPSDDREHHENEDIKSMTIFIIVVDLKSSVMMQNKREREKKTRQFLRLGPNKLM